MTCWLDLVRGALEESAQSIAFFFRDDDVGWGDERLPPLLDLFVARGLPLDLAVIPAALGDDTAHRLSERCATAAGRLRIHQHGWRHANHESAGRKGEFGASRAVADQAADLQAGRARLKAALGPFVDPIFTPPWNRCTRATVGLLAANAYRVLSRDDGATPLETGGLAELPIAVDWQKQMAQTPNGSLPGPALGPAIARVAAKGSPVGIMLHHAVTTDGGLAALAALLDLLARHDKARCLTMMDCAEAGG
jgi:peptidoglycan/xylan/chitin deacetylase (PgdA/CDA1 family)